jgi:hypothetical protein
MRKKLQASCVYACEAKRVHARIYARVLTWLQEMLRAYNERQQQEHRAQLDEEERVSDELH